MKKVIALSTFTAVTAFAVPAGAQTVNTASGGRVEAIVGYDRPQIEIDGTNDKVKDSGALYGVGAGYDFAVSPSVSVGADVEASDSTAKKSFDDGVTTAKLSAGRDLYAGGRVTFPVSSRANLYVKGGYTNFRVKGELDGSSDSRNLDGWRVGAGGQLNVAGKAYVGGEYRYSNYEDNVDRQQVALTLGTRL